MELRLRPHCGRASLQRGQRLRDLAGTGDRDMDVVWSGVRLLILVENA
jgi:hypothetical protein